MLHKYTSQRKETASGFTVQKKVRFSLSLYIEWTLAYNIMHPHKLYKAFRKKVTKNHQEDQVKLS